MITIRELKDYIARYEEAGWLSDDSPVVLGLQSGPHEAATVGIGKAPNISPLRALRIGVEMHAKALTVTTGLEEGHPTTVSVTGRMSDNPADSLRRELKLRVAEANEAWEAQGHNDGAPPAFIASKLITPVMAALEAARAERERIAKAIEAEPCDARKRPGDQNRAQSEAST